MDLLVDPLVIGLALAMDCLAVSFAAGARQRSDRIKAMAVLAFMFGFFQFGMTLLGWLLGSGFAQAIAAYDHVVAVGLLFVIGIKMIVEGIHDDEEEKVPDIFNLYTVTILAIATSIDALAVGISFAFLLVPPFLPAFIIGLVTAGVSVIGVAAGGKAGKVLGHRVDILGGLILILIGIRILVEHML